MKEHFACPVCGLDDWERFGVITYDASEHQVGGPLHDHPYLKLRRNVLFEIWFPGQDRVELHPQFCRRCGFVCYTPRPDASDIQAKYEYLQRTEVDIGGQSGSSEIGVHLDERRAQRIRRTLEHFTSLHGLCLLDVGGGDGKLLAPFQHAGCKCHLVDYNLQPRPGITRLGNTVNEIPDGQRFDLLLCSHVLEHVAAPVPFLAEFLRVLRPSGLVYVEVPLEVWKRIAILVREPVTHVNFFTPATITTALRRAGFEVLECAAGFGTYGAAHSQIVWAVARPSATRVEVRLPGSGATRSLVYPGTFQLIRNAFYVQPRLEGRLTAWLRVPARVVRRIAGTKEE